ncbi:hypothetical protein [Photobacterium damselae]|uniref:hypothetical protein n=1 Tax=Photobacterium damselae TaxID=38293 RepID=UPI000D04CFE1|nr:hypothetical protein [Photobacterium damselae]AWK81603.1 hypothetical protein BST98_05835 [Photobacterium damselae]NVO76107.1 hypothetical protein [Photobacterium damselae subsp. damselae]PSB76044.1 hypothetical protein C5F61_19300 [Photobacterium damselae subsp. damselae]UKA02833.1 hypothetical protein IHC89_05840 [Photobacterium damselae subsp. damselae]SPY23625.1 Uncharacterised protein [Photobacterium damselae]
MKSPIDKLLDKHQDLIHSDNVAVISHTQREDGDWVLHTLMIENCSAPFQFRRKKKYRSLTGDRVNMTYYADSIKVAGFDMEIMKVVRIKRS